MPSNAIEPNATDQSPPANEIGVVSNWSRTPVGLYVLLFALQAVTGTLMMTVYSPSPNTAWGSVWFLQTQVDGGWLVRGLHTFASNAMLVLCALHVCHWVFTNGYRRLGIVSWSLTVLLVPLTLGVALVGELLPWDQHGYWGTQVRTNILARTPFVGEHLRQLLLGGTEFGHLTLTRFYTLHIVVLPLLIVGVLWMRKRSTHSKFKTRADAPMMPVPDVDRSAQMLRDSVIFALVFCMIAWFVYQARSAGAVMLDAPADPTASEYPARPEWHTLFLYQWLKYFHGPAMERIGAIIIPSAILALILSFPLLGRARRPQWLIAIPNITIALLLCAIGILSYLGVRADRDPKDSSVLAVREKEKGGEDLSRTDHHVLSARQYYEKSQMANRLADRSFVLAEREGIPPDGPLALMMNDPVTRGPALFAEHCSSCHRFEGHNGLGVIPSDGPTSSDLGAYGSAEWIRSFLTDPMADRFYGLMKKPDGDPAHTRMSKWIDDIVGEQESDEDRAKLMRDFDAVALYLADEAQYPGRFAQDPTNADADPANALIVRGREFFMSVCNECHRYQGQHSGTLKAPEMFGYGSIDWIEQMIADPSHDTRFRNRGRERAQMPSFKDRLSARDRNLLATWLHQSAPEIVTGP